MIGEGNGKPLEIKGDEYFKKLLEKFDIGEVSFCGNAEYKQAIDQLYPVFCMVFDSVTAEEVKSYKKDILLYVAHYPSSIFRRKKEVKEKQEKQERIFKEIADLKKMIQKGGESGLSSVRMFASMDYKDMYKFIKDCLTSDRPDLQKKAWDLLNNNDVHRQFVWMRANIIVDCWQAANAKGKEEFLNIAMEQHIKNGCARHMDDNFIDEDGIEYKQYMFISPDGQDMNYIRRIPIATDKTDKWGYESLLEKYGTPKSVQMLIENSQAEKLYKEYHKTCGKG